MGCLLSRACNTKLDWQTLQAGHVSSAGGCPCVSMLQNNGVISLTGVASRWAGWGASFWLVLFGLLGKTGGLVLSIPDCVLGGATTFLFAAGM